MMEVIWFLMGWVRLRLTSADCAARLREISRGIRLEQIVYEDELTVSFCVRRKWAKEILIRKGERLEQIGAGGLPVLLARLRRWPLVTATAAILLALTFLLPTRIWFIRVEGNGEIPRRLILECAEDCGVFFGASRREIRSEQVKNHLLWAIPQLSWAGVNTQGCTAVITVTARAPEDSPPEEVPGDLVAVREGVVSELVVEQGSACVSPGQAVREGQVLISGSSDLGITVLQDRARGEVYGLTRRSVTAVLPKETGIRQENGRTVTRRFILIGKNRVNFSDDSGILHGTCVKMRTVKHLKLPGGFQLPVALVTETYYLSQIRREDRPDPEGLLLAAARDCVKTEMTAGTIVGERVSCDGMALTAVFDCREMIAAFRPGFITEGDTND